MIQKLSGTGSALLFGRKSVGKTALVQESIKNKPHIFYQGVKLPAPMIYKELGMLIGEKISNTALKSGEIGGAAAVAPKKTTAPSAAARPSGKKAAASSAAARSTSRSARH